jgi:type VI secretion system protein ImpF
MSGRQAAPRRADIPLLDRLLDEAPPRSGEPSPREAMELLHRSVRRDLEMLLNSRRRWRSCAASLQGSALAYGMPDYTAGSFRDRRRREALRADIEATLKLFEPRFAQVRVTLLDGPAQAATLRLKIEAELHTRAAPEPVEFETLVDAATADVQVRASDV